MRADTVATPPTSLWGGQAGQRLATATQVVGARVVTVEGRHGVVLEPPYHAVHYGRPGHRIPMDDGFTRVRYDSGAVELRRATELFEERSPPLRGRVEADPPAWRLHREPGPDERMTAEALLRELAEAGERARASSPAAAEALRERLREPLTWLLAWRQRHLDTPVRALLSSFELYRLRYEVFGTSGSPDAAQQLARMASLPPDWRTRWTVGQRVRAPWTEGEPEGGWTLARLEGDEALLTGHGRQRWANLWTLEPDYTAGYSPLPSTPVSLFDLARALQARYTGRDPMVAFAASKAENRAHWRALAPALTAWLREQGVPLKADQKAGRLHIAPPRTPLTREEKSRLAALIPGLVWDETGAFVGDVMVPPEHVGRVSALLAHALRHEGQHMSALGEARRHQNASTCAPETFELKGHGTIRVDCGDPNDPEAWHSLYVNDLRFAWGGGRWLKNKLPPLAVLNAVRERGIRVFG